MNPILESMDTFIKLLGNESFDSSTLGENFLKSTLGLISEAKKEKSEAKEKELSKFFDEDNTRLL